MIEHLTVYIGDDTVSFRVLIRTINQTAIPYKNYGRKIKDNEYLVSDTVYLHTTDLVPKKLHDILYNCKELIFVEPVSWTSKDVEHHTIGWLDYISTCRPVKMLKAGEYGKGVVDYESKKFVRPLFLNPVAQRQTEGKQIWVVGCSFAHGHGLDDVNLRFGQLIANKLELPVSFLSITGASNQWAADQILRSDIRSGDIVIWGITGTARTTIYTDERVWPITIHLLDQSEKTSIKSLFSNGQKISHMRRMVSEEFLLSDHSLYDSINHIEQVFNHLNKIEVEYLMGYFADLDYSYINHMGKMIRYIIGKNDPRLFVIRPEYPWADIIIRSHTDINNENAPIDPSLTQGAHHPGPRQHAVYADQFLTTYNKIYH
jgi:hypothetical protein